MTTDWFTSIQRCFQWSERAEQRPLEAGLMSQVGRGRAALRCAAQAGERAFRREAPSRRLILPLLGTPQALSRESSLTSAGSLRDSSSLSQ